LPRKCGVRSLSTPDAEQAPLPTIDSFLTARRQIIGLLCTKTKTGLQSGKYTLYDELFGRRSWCQCFGIFCWATIACVCGKHRRCIDVVRKRRSGWNRRCSVRRQLQAADDRGSLQPSWRVCKNKNPTKPPTANALKATSPGTTNHGNTRTKTPVHAPFAGGYPYRGSQRLPSDPDALTYLAAVAAADGAPVEVGVATAVDDFFKGCKADGTFSALKAACILCGARTLAGALVPLAGDAPTNNNFVDADYNRETGLIGNGSTKYLDSSRATTTTPSTPSANP
jgi:hypothetical protein